MIRDAWKLNVLRVALVVCPGCGLQAQQGFPTVSPFELGYSLRSWTMDNGLKGPYLGAFVQVRDGALLFSDSEGLIRYNGIELQDLIESAAPEVPRRQILDIHEDAAGRLWTVGLSGQAMRETDGRWVAIGSDRGGRSGVGKFAAGPDGRLWCAVSSPTRSLMVSVYEDGRFQPALARPLLSGYVQELEFDSAGRLWLSVASQGAGPSVYRLEGNTLVPEAGPDWNMGTLFRQEADPRLWVVTRQAIRVREADGWHEVVRFSDAVPEGNGFSACVLDGDGNYWIATRSLGLWVCQPDGRVSRLISEEVKFPNLVRDLFTGRDGTVWLNGENGLIQLRRQPFTLWPQPQRHRRAAIRAMAEDGQETLWFGGVGIYSLRPGEFARQHWQDDTAIPSVYGMLGRPEGGAWFVTSGSGGGLGTVTSEGQWVIAQPPGGSFGPVLDLVEHEGEVWMAWAGGLLRLQDGALAPAAPEEAAQDPPECLASGPEGELYAGFRTKGLFSRKNGQWSFAGLDGWVGALALAPDRTLWARRGENELCWLGDGGWLRADAGAMGIVPQFHMVCSREGSIWFQGLRGPVIRIDRKAAGAWLRGDRAVDLRLRTYGRAEGLPAEQHPYGSRKRTLMEDRQGRIWVATVQGVGAWLPSYEAGRDTATRRKGPMPVLIERVLIDDTPVLNPNGAVTVPPDKHRIEIHYAGLDLASPESVVYRFRVEGYEDEWIEVGNRHTAYFYRIPPGAYRFQVIAADRHGVWNENGAVLAIQVLPHWYEHRLFRFGAPAVLVVAFSGLAYRRVRWARRRALERARLQEEFSRGLIEAQESERARLAGELHDDLGQDLLVMKSRIDLARRRSSSETEQKTLQQLSASAADVLQKMRSLSHQLRPLHLDHLGLSVSVSSLVKEVAEAGTLDYEVEVTDVDEALTPEATVAVYRMLQESLSNVIKHARAKSVKVALQRHGGNALLIISDDGCGFEGGTERLSSEGPGHGLRAMKERCALLGGTFEVISGIGEGTLIRMEIPLRRPEGA